MKKILSAILAVMLLVGALVIPSAAALPVVIDKVSGFIKKKKGGESADAAVETEE